MRARATQFSAIPALLCLVIMAAPHSRAEDPWDDSYRAPAAVDPRYPFLAEKPVPDKPLKERLTKTHTYTTRSGDTLRKIAHILYGHKTWWKRVKADNKQFLSYRPDDILPPGKTIHYRAAYVGNEYIVKQGDWLIRIAQWKYGKTDFWQELYRKNKDTIRDPDLIHPGDRLRFYKDGTIRVAGSNRVVVSGVKRQETAKTAKEPTGTTSEPDPAEQLAATGPEPAEQVDEAAPAERPEPITETAQPAGNQLNDPPVTANPWNDEKPRGTEVATGENGRGPSSEQDPLAESWWESWPLRLMLLAVLLALLWAAFAYARSRDLILYPKRGFRGYAFDRKPPKPTRGPYDDLYLDEDFLDESNIDRIDIRPRPNYQSLWKVWLRKKLRVLGKNQDR